MNLSRYAYFRLSEYTIITNTLRPAFLFVTTGVCYNRVILFTKLSNFPKKVCWELVITEFVITEFVTTKVVIAKFQCKSLSKIKSNYTGCFTHLDPFESQNLRSKKFSKISTTFEFKFYHRHDFVWLSVAFSFFFQPFRHLLKMMGQRYISEYNQITCGG